MTHRDGRRAIVEQLLADGHQFVFGNPGTVEQGLLDTLGDHPRLKYILALQESIAVLMADGYARATRRPALVQVHSSPGVGNAIGNLYQAKRGGTPLLVFAGEAGLAYDAMDAQMAADLVAMAKPVTKWATRIVDPRSVLRVLRRATKVAATPPTGPVFVSLPADILDLPNEEEVVATSFPLTRVVPAAEEVSQMAAALASAERPMFLIGDGVGGSGAQTEVTRLAERVGAKVWGVNSSEVNMSCAHPLFKGQIGHMFGEQSRIIVNEADVVLIVGTYLFPEVFPALSGVFARGARILHIDLDANEIAKNFPVTLGLVADPKLTLAAVANELERQQTSAQRDTAAVRARTISAATHAELSEARRADAVIRENVPMGPARFMEELAAQLPPDAIVFDEALTCSNDVTRYCVPEVPGSYFQLRGGSLGAGVPGAIGLKLANPERTVIGFAGDGGSMYTIQALWTAAHHRVGAKFVICNNRSYKLLKVNIQEYWKEAHSAERDFPASFDINDPNIEFVELAHSLGVPGVRVERPEEIAPAIKQMLANDGPFLIDLVLDTSVPKHFVYHKCGQ